MDKTPMSLKQRFDRLLYELNHDSKIQYTLSTIAKGIGVHRSTLKRIYDGEILMSYEVAIALEKWERSLKGRKGIKATTWINTQTKYQIYMLQNSQL